MKSIEQQVSELVAKRAGVELRIRTKTELLASLRNPTLDPFWAAAAADLMEADTELRGYAGNDLRAIGELQGKAKKAHSLAKMRERLESDITALAAEVDQINHRIQTLTEQAYGPSRSQR